MWMVLLYGVATFMELGLGCGCLVGCFQNGNPVQNTDGQK